MGRRGGVVMLGKLCLQWCDACDLPILEEKACGACRGATRPVRLTPPGDIRPAFGYDLDLVRATADAWFGEGCGRLLLPDGELALLNKVPDFDRMDELIVGGEVLGALRFNTDTSGWGFLPRVGGARRFARAASRHWVVADEGAIPSILKSSNLMGPGVVDCDAGIAGNDEIVLMNRARQALAVGRALRPAHELKALLPGVAIKVRHRDAPREPDPRRPARGWRDALAANEPLMERRERNAIRHIHRVRGQFPEAPVAVSYSGGKDSLATTIIAVKAGLKPKMLFVNTGLEFPETVKNVHDTAAKYGLEVAEERALDSFWKGMEHFGPPGKDYRWCCKLLKLGPAAKVIEKNFEGEVPSLIGQRRYESESRAAHGSTWRNPWVKNQIGTSPIQDWTALHVWFYLWREKAEVNPWYERGLDRIGCFMCPASSQAQLQIVKESYRGYARFQKEIEGYAAKKGFAGDWMAYDLWRWRRLPGHIQEMVKARGLELRDPNAPEPQKGGYNLHVASGYEPCTGGVSIEAVFETHLDIQRVTNMLNTVGPAKLEDDGQVGVVHEKRYPANATVEIFPDGHLVVRGKDEKDCADRLEKVRQMVLWSETCVSCNACVPRCPFDALKLPKGETIQIDESKCTHCGLCFGPCPVVDFDPNKFFEW
jgi:phosphoadenosine phosphosulfate reductase